MQASLLVITKTKFAFLTPVVRSLKSQNTSLRITCMYREFLFVLYCNTIDPHVHVLSQVHACEVLDPLVDHEPRIVQQLSTLINDPYSHSSIGTACHQLTHFLDIHHIQNASFMSHNCLKARIALDVTWLPKFDGPVCRRGDQNIKFFLHTCINDLTDCSLVAMRRVYRSNIWFLALLEDGTLVHRFTFKLQQFPICQTQKNCLIFGAVAIGAHEDLEMKYLGVILVICTYLF